MIQRLRLLAVALAVVGLLTSCGGGGGGGPSTSTGSDDRTSNNGGATPSDPTPGTPDPDTGTPSSGGDTTSGGGTTSGTTTPPGDPSPTDSGDLRGKLWDHDDDGTTPEIPYEFLASYTIPEEDDLATTDENERTDAIDRVKQDSDYAQRTVDDIGVRINGIRDGTEVAGGIADGAPLADWQQSMLRSIIVTARGVSMGIDAAAQEDIDQIDRELARLSLFKAVAERAAKALTDEAARLQSRATRKETEATRKETRADERDAEINGADSDYDGPTIDSLTTAADALNIEISDLNNEISDARGEKASVDNWLAHYADGANRPDGVNPTGCTDAATCRARSVELGAEVDPKQMIIDTKRAEETELRNQITALQQEVTDLRDEATALREEATMARNDADELSTDISAARDRVTTIEAEEKRVTDRHETDRGRARTGVLAVNVQDRLVAIARMDDPGTRLVGRTGTIADIDAAGDAVFGRATPSGTTPADALRVFARINGAEVRQDTLNAPAPSATAGTPERAQEEEFEALDTGLGAHWRMTVSDFLLADTDLDTTDRQTTGNARGDSVPGTFKGVRGTFYCDGSQCSALTATTFRNGWYFTPSVARPGSAATDPKAFRYADADDDGVYEPVHYVDYGLWLVDDGSMIDIAARAGLIGPTPGDRVNPDITTLADAVNNLGDDTATYSGQAQGLSARSQYKDSDYVTASGHFTADVELNARFGTTPSLGGTIDNFRSVDPDNQGTDHVNSDWSITLRNWTTSSGDTRGGRGTFAGDAVTGHWSAFGHGAPGRRPDGFYGGFTAAFKDDAFDQNPDGTSATGDGTVTPGPDGNLYDDGAAIGLFSTTRGGE